MSRLALITFLTPDAPGVDNSLPGVPTYPSQGLPGAPPVPGNALPPFATQLPVYPFDPTVPDNSLPGGGTAPDNSLPRPGKKYIVKWLACVGLILVPDNSLPSVPVTPGNELPETPEPK